MTNEELQIIINEIEKQHLEDQATFAILMYGGGSDESFIQANKQGLLLFANELLKAAKSFDSVITDTTQKSIPFDYEANWIDQDSNTFIQYVLPVTERPLERFEAKDKNSVFEKILPVGCGLIVIILIAALLVGLWTLGKLFF